MTLLEQLKKMEGKTIKFLANAGAPTDGNLPIQGELVEAHSDHIVIRGVTDKKSRSIIPLTAIGQIFFPNPVTGR